MKPSPLNTSPCSISLLFSSSAVLLALTYLLLRPNYSLFSTTCTTTHSSPAANSSTIPSFRLLIGIQTIPEKFARRHLIRHVNSLQPSHSALVDIRFVLCNLTREDHAVFVALEIMHYNDIIILNCTENLADGKTYTFFSTLPRLFRDEPYDYVMKADDDIYFRLDKLVESLKGKAREDVYYGLGLPFQNREFPPFMVGFGYILSWDLVEWISTSEITREHANGVEDLLTGRWLDMGRRGRNRYNTYPAMYDYKGPNQEDFREDTIGVHQLKDDLTWARTLKHFNVTQGLKPSQLYHIP
ncbi:beta-1,3-galactosyltransferase pvg3-like [Typha latifolia]|uniref:beta-1,3-galactosyltransferase pvg3-like n=1 Tax=Typha latifolia TaxID=4733 RepID=UPI003C2E5113